MIQSVSGFIDYFESIRRRTVNYIQTVPADHIDWSPKAGEFTCGDIVRHLAAGESMFVGAVTVGRWTYPGHDRAIADSRDQVLTHLNDIHTAALTSLRTLDDTQLLQPRPTLNGPPVKAWRLLMAMVEHEIHHRSQLAMYLSLIGIKPPHIYGLGVEDVIALATE